MKTIKKIQLEGVDVNLEISLLEYGMAWFKTDLHGNKIAEWRENGLHMSLAGWNTVTTRERLNGIAQTIGLKVSFTQNAFEPLFKRGVNRC